MMGKKPIAYIVWNARLHGPTRPLSSVCDLTFHALTDADKKKGYKQIPLYEQ